MNLRAWLEKQAPDFLLTGQRFPFAILFAALTTVVVICAINGVDWMREEVWARAALGFATAAVLAVAGVYFAESRPEARVAGPVLKYALPVAVAAAFQITDIAWFVPYAIPAVAIFWLSVSPFTRIERGAPRDEVQNRFWWVNFQAVATAVIAAAAFLIIALGLAAIERSLAILFGLETGQVFYNWVLPFTGLFLTPVYWLSTLPHLSAYRAEELEKPDFLPRAFGFLGQFMLVPLLLIYALILLAYTAQIVATQKLPEGMIGWMVLGFVVIGAATLLVLHPPFMRTRALVRLFRSWWFWLTLIPLALFFVAVWIRIDAYGLTDERMLLAAGGIWATALAAIYLLGRGDIRLIPALAGVVLLVLSVGPWNYANLPVAQQTMRLDAVVMNAGADKSAGPPRGDWSTEEIVKARGIIDYLTSSREGQRAVREVMGRYGVTWDTAQDGPQVVLEALGVSQPSIDRAVRYPTLFRDFDGEPVDVSATPYLIRPISLYGVAALEAPPLRLWVEAGGLRVGPAGTPDLEVPLVDLSAWLASQTGAFIEKPVIPLVVDGRNYSLLVQSVTIDRGENNAGPAMISSLEAQLFSDVPR